MQSPFDIFRKHQKMLTVVLTGLAMFAFVILGAVPDPSAMPPLLGAIFLGGVVGGLAWLAGIRSKKSNEWGLVGFLIGMGLGLAAMMAVGPGDVVRADTGNINQVEMSNLIRQRSVANNFVGMAYGKAQENGYQAMSSPFRFGFGHPDETRDLVVGELLRREADRIGMAVTDEAVNDFIRTLYQEKIGAADVREIRNAIGVSESELYQALSAELKATNAADFFYGGITVPNGRNPLPPVEYWEFYRKMNIEQSVGIVPLQVSAFIDESATPPEAELQELFVKHKGNFPNTTPEGRLEEGLIGFRQPRRVALEYIEIPYEAVEATVGEVTDEEIEQYYKEFYASAPDLPPGAGQSAPSTDGPALPDLPSGDAPSTDKPEMKAPADEAPAPDQPAAPAESPEKPAETPAPADEAKPETPATPDAAPAPADEPKQDAPPAEPQTDQPAESDKPSEADDADAADEAPAPSDESGASLPTSSALQLVAFLDDEPAAEEPQESPADQPADTPSADDEPAPEQPAEDKPAEEPAAAEKPADAPAADQPADKPAAETPEKPAADAADKPAAEEPPAEPSDKPAADTGDTPPPEPAPPTGPRELDDELRAEIRDQILRRKTAEKQQVLMRQTFELMGVQLSPAVNLPESEPDHVSPEAATGRLKEFAEENGLVYARTPLITMRELSQSEEHPVGRATSVANMQSFESAAQLAFSSPASSLFNARQVMGESGSRFVFWKVEDVESYEPKSLDDPGMHEQVLHAWRVLQAREKARARAQELAKQADGVDKPLSEIFAGATATGEEGADAVAVVQPPKFSWLSAPDAQMSPNPFNRPTPTLTELRTVPGDVGEEFMRTVFNDLEPGEAGVAHSFDMEYFYVVKVEDRSYGSSPDQQAFRERFVTQPIFDQFGFSDYFKLAARELGQYQTNWADELFERHGVVFAERTPTQDQES